MASIFDKLTTTTSECAEYINNTQTCLSDKFIKVIEKFADKDIEDTKELLHCETESCLLENNNLRKFIINKTNLSSKDIDYELATRFKPDGPRETTELLNNYNIDETLKQWSFVFTDFFPCPFAMIDFEETYDVLSTVDFVDIYDGYERVNNIKHPCRTFGCVVNTDVSSGNGKHWVCVFVDMRKPKWTIEYFNSSGRYPPKQIIKWMEKSIKKIESRVNRNIKCEGVIVSNMCHQKSKTECGLYALFYIRSRIEGVPYIYFRENIIADKLMVEFRQHLFR